MAKRSKRDRPRSSRRGPAVSTSGEVITVAWMLSMLATVSAEVLGILIRWTAMQFGETDRLQVLSGTLLVTAFVAGVATLIMTPITLRLRQTPPPRAILVTAIIVGMIPILTVLILMLR